MRRRILLVVLLAAATLVGCAGLNARKHGPSGDQLAYRRNLSRQAQAAIDHEDWPGARAYLLQLLAADPTAPEVHQRLGRVATEVGDLPGAEASYRKALELDPDYPEALCGLASVELAANRLDDAQKHAEAAVDIAPDRARHHWVQGQVLQAAGQVDEALAAYFRALSRDPTMVEALAQVAAIQLEREQYDQALARYTHALELNSSDLLLRYGRGRAHLALGQNAEAVDDFTAAAARFPDRPDVQYHLALALERAERFDEARVAINRAAALAPREPPVRELAERLRR